MSSSLNIDYSSKTLNSKDEGVLRAYNTTGYTAAQATTVNPPSSIEAPVVQPFLAAVGDDLSIIVVVITRTRTSTVCPEQTLAAGTNDSTADGTTSSPITISSTATERSDPSPIASLATMSSLTEPGAANTSASVASARITHSLGFDLPASTGVSSGSTDGRGIFFQVSTSAVIPSVSISTMSSDSGVVQILPTLTTRPSSASGTILTSINSSVGLQSGPLISTSISAPDSTISPTGPVTSITNTMRAGTVSNNIFQPVATNAPPSVFSTRSDHPVPRLGIQPQNLPLDTNKFYANFFLGSQTAATWTHPYSIAWSKGGGSSGSWGLAISHIDDNQKVYGPNPSANPASYFINPNGIQSLILSALELGSSSILSLDSLTTFSTNVNLLSSPGDRPAITFPLVQGMGFITGIYNGGTPILQTGVFFRSITKATTNPKPGVTKYTVLLEDGKSWFLYAHSDAGTELDFTVVNNGLAQATSNFKGIIQIAKNSGGDAEVMYDAACGVYPTSATLAGSVSSSEGSYELSFVKAGMSNVTLAMFALPHHVTSFNSNTKSAITSVQLSTTTKGLATAVLADSWTLIEELPTSMGFAPWTPSGGLQKLSLSATSLAAILSVAASEVSQNMSQQTNLNSMYYSGKALAKFAGIVYTLSDILQNPALAQAGLSSLKTSFALFASNVQQFPLVYETAWGGLVSSASYTTGDSGADFGNTYYNDHHFHYGYFIYTAAVIGYLDPTWLVHNKDYVNALVRDIANPSTEDNYFPESRMFDWYHGHSWAHGLYETFDGKDEESSSEDSMSAYAIKMWGRTIGDANMEARGNLQLAITARSLQSYFLYTSNNSIEPANFIDNKVAGILFENKIDHTTYFGANPEYIQGIHMLPLLPHSTLTRTKQFVQEEWDTYFSNGRVDAVLGGWKGILYANLAIVDPAAAWQFFSQSTFDASWLDGGASRTWYMALAAGLGGAT